MTQTARVPAPEPVSDMLREATRLKALEPRRLAPLFALYDLPRWCVRHALWMFACVCRVGCPVAFRKPVSGPPLSGRASRARVLGCADLECHPPTSPAAGASYGRPGTIPQSAVRSPVPTANAGPPLTHVSRARVGVYGCVRKCTEMVCFRTAPHRPQKDTPT